MKQIISGILLASTLLISMPGQAQFFKKLKKTVKELVVTPAGASTNADVPEQSTASGHMDVKRSPDPRGARAKAGAGLPVFAPSAGVEIITQLTMSAMDQYLVPNSVVVDVKDGKLRTVVPVANFTKDEALSELGEGSSKDVVNIYENGNKAQTTTVGQIDKKLMTINKKFDFPFGEELVRSSSQEADKYVKKTVAALSSTINFAGNKYGPYMIVGDLLVNHSRDRFFAQICATLADGEHADYALLGMDKKTRKVQVGGDLIANRDFTSAAILVTKAAIINYQILKTEDEKKQAALQQSLVDASTQEPNVGNVSFLNGKTLNAVLLSSPWLDESGRNFFSETNDDQGAIKKGTYLNGQLIFPEASAQGKAWCNADGSKWAVEVTEYKDHKAAHNVHLHFSDGTDAAGAWQAHELCIEGHYYMVWYYYDHQVSDQMVVYRKAL